MSSDALTSPASERNKTVIGDIIAKYIPDERNIELLDYNALEIAAGYGAHIMYNSKRFPQIKWTVTEKDPGCIKSINAHLNSSKPARTNITGPFPFDVSDDIGCWPQHIKGLVGKFDLVMAVNLLHITEWENVQALFAIASRLLKGNGEGKLLTYGPFAFQGVLAPESNVEFDKHLKLSNPEWGIRDVSDLEKEASREGNIFLEAVHDMPANNKILVWSTSLP